MDTSAEQVDHLNLKVSRLPDDNCPIELSLRLPLACAKPKQSEGAILSLCVFVGATFDRSMD